MEVFVCSYGVAGQKISSRKDISICLFVCLQGHICLFVVMVLLDRKSALARTYLE